MPDSGDPIDHAAAIERQVDQWFDSMLAGWPAFSSAVNRRLSMPTVDVQDKGDHYLVKADLPGMDKSEIRARVQGSRLVIEGSREVRKDEGGEGESFWRAERFNGRFRRSVSLPGEVKSEGLRAFYDNGVLTLSLPKQPGPGYEPKEVEIF